MGELETNEELNINISLNDSINNTNDVPLENTEENIPDETNENNSTAIIEYKEIDEPCVALTIVGENRLTDAEVFVRRGLKYTIKAFFSAIALTIINLFI